MKIGEKQITVIDIELEKAAWLLNFLQAFSGAACSAKMSQ
jgi:hypothetical protein